MDEESAVVECPGDGSEGRLLTPPSGVLTVLL